MIRKIARYFLRSRTIFSTDAWFHYMQKAVYASGPALRHALMIDYWELARL
jgi:hypothetical protein